MTSFNHEGHNLGYALIVANGASCSKQLMSQLLADNPYIIILDGAIHRYIETNFPCHALLGDFDRNEIQFDEIQRVYPDLHIQQVIDQEKTDLEKAIDFLIERNYQQVDIIWATGKRADHTITNITNLCRYRGKIKARILDDFSTIELLPRIPEAYKKDYTKGTPISLIPIGTVTGITTKNLLYPLSNETLTMGYRTGSSNEILADGTMEISYETGDLLLMECND